MTTMGGGGGNRRKRPLSRTDPAASIAADPMQFLTSIYKPRGATDGICAYYQSLIHGCEDAVKQLPPAFVSMANGTLYDVFKDNTDCFVAMAHSLKNHTAVGMCTRPRLRAGGTFLYPIFFDMDVFSTDACGPADLQLMLRDFMLPTMKLFFGDAYHCDAMRKTHFAIYYAQEEGCNTVARQTKSKLICGLCEKGTLHRSMEYMEAYAECKVCGVRFACSSLDGGVDTITVEPLMFSKAHFIKAYRARVPFADIPSLMDPEPWTHCNETTWNTTTRVLTFHHGAMELETALRPIKRHIDQTSYKYGFHVKALNVEWLTRSRRLNIGLRRMMDTYLGQLVRKSTSVREATLRYISFLKKQIKQNSDKNKLYLTPADIQLRAMSKLPTLFLTESALNAPTELLDLDRYIVDQVDTLLFDKNMAITLCDFLASKAIQWQETLDPSNFWKTIDMSEAFDRSVYRSGLRVPYARKIFKCVHVRHRSKGTGELEEVNCLRCDGKGSYIETERPPYELQSIVNSSGEPCPALCTYLQTNLAGQLALTTIRLPIASALTGVQVKEVGNMIAHMKRIPRSFHEARSGVPDTNPNDVAGGWKAYTGTVDEITRRDVIDPLQTWIRQLQPEWAHLSLRKLKKRKNSRAGPTQLPQYWVDVDPRSSGSRSCPYLNGEHSKGTIYFLLRPPTSKKDVENLHGKILYFCWSNGCDGASCAMNLRKKGHLPKQLVLRIWDPTSFVTQVGRLGNLAPTLAAISRREVASQVTRAGDIQRLVKQGENARLNQLFSTSPETTPAVSSSSSASSSASSSSSSSASASSSSLASASSSSSASASSSSSASASSSSSASASSSSSLASASSSSSSASASSSRSLTGTAGLYHAMNGDLLVSCHALLYKRNAKICKPSKPFSAIFTSMNQ